MHSGNNKSRPFSSDPSVIPVFFATEMWERFGFYMIQSLLILYMTSGIFRFSDSKSYAVLGVFSALTWITPIIGGYFASKILDYEHAITLGGFLLVIGYALLSLPHEHLFYVALAIIVTGNGFFKPSISSYLGNFYKKNDLHREKGYTIFYVGINIGTMLSTSISGFLVRYFGWHLPFLIASLTLFFGIMTFVVGLYYLKEIKNFNRVEPAITTHQNPLTFALVYISIIAIIIVSYVIIRHRVFAGELMLWGGIATLITVITLSFRYEESIRNKMIACFFLMLIAVAFWALYFQMFFSMSLFIERVVNRTAFNMLLPTPLFFSLEATFVIIFGYCFAVLWGKLSTTNKNPGFPVKFSLSLFALAIAFTIAYASMQYAAPTGIVSMSFIVFIFLFIALSELLISPIGMAMISVLVPQEILGTIMGLWFVTIGLGEKLASNLANYAAIPKNIQTIPVMDKIYGHAFLRYALLSLGAAIVFSICIPFLNKMIAGKKQKAILK